MQDLPPLTRRRLVQAGAGGAATLWLGGFSRLVPVASASPLASELKRSTWLGVTDPAFQVALDGSSIPLQFTGVGDLGVAAKVPALQGSDAAFSVRFRGDGGTALGSGTRTLSHPELGTFDLFVSPVEQRGASQDYEAVVDRTIKITGINEEGAPAPVDPGPRGGGTPPSGSGESAPAASAAAPAAAGAQSAPAATVAAPATGSAQSAPAATVAAPAAASPRPAPPAGAARTPVAQAPRLLRAALEPSPSGRRMLADVTLGGPNIAEVHAILFRRGKVVGRASAKGHRRLKLRFALRTPTRTGGTYELVLTVVDRAGKVTRLRRHLRVG